MVVSLNSSHICTQTYLILQPVCPSGLGGDLILEKRPTSCVQDGRPLINGCVCPEHTAAGMVWPPWLVVLRWAFAKRIFNICLSGYFQDSCTALFEIFNLIWDVWGFLKLFLWFIKERKCDHTNLNRMIKRPNGNLLICCPFFFWLLFSDFICREFSSQLLLCLSINLSICITEHCKDWAER